MVGYKAARKLELTSAGLVGARDGDTGDVRPFAFVSDSADAFFNVKDYGATGLNDQDDRPAIQAAIDAAADAHGGTVYFPPGEYSIRTLGIVLPRNGYPLSSLSGNIKLVGAGVNATSLTDSGYLDPTLPMIRYAATPTLESAAGLELRSMTIARSSDGRIFSHVKPTGDVVYERLIRCTFQDLYLRGKVATASPAPTATLLYIDGGIQCQFLNVSLDGGALAVNFKDCSHMYAAGLYTGVDTYAQAGILIDGGGNHVLHCRVEGTNGGYGIKLTGNTDNNLLIGPTFEGKATSPQIDIDSANNTLIQAPAIAGPNTTGLSGIRCRADSRNVRVVGGRFGDFSAQSGYGLLVDSGALHVSVEGTHFYGGMSNNVSIDSGAFDVRVSGFTGNEPEERRIIVGGTWKGTLLLDASSVREWDNFAVSPGSATDFATLSDGYNGQVLTLMFTNGNATMKHGTGNIRLAGGADFVSSANDVMKLVYDGTNWLETNRSVNG